MTIQEIKTTTARNIIAYRMGIFWFVVFSINALGTAILGSLMGADWSQMSPQQHFMVVVTIAVNWTGTIMAYFKKIVKDP